MVLQRQVEIVIRREKSRFVYANMLESRDFSQDMFNSQLEAQEAIATGHKGESTHSFFAHIVISR